MADKKILLLDIDEVVCFSGFVEAVNDFLGTNYEVDDFTDYYIDEVTIPKDRIKEFNEFTNNRNMYNKNQILPRAQEVTEKLNELYEVHVLSSCVNQLNINGSGKFFKDKYDFLIENFPHLIPQNFIFTSNKDVINGDIIIDDRLPNLKSSIKTKILFPSYHNKDILNSDLDKMKVVRAGYDWRNGWTNIEKLLVQGEELEDGTKIDWVKKYVKEIKR